MMAGHPGGGGSPRKPTHLLGVRDVAGVSQNEGAELVEILHGSLPFLQRLRQTALGGYTPAPSRHQTPGSPQHPSPRYPLPSQPQLGGDGPFLKTLIYGSGAPTAGRNPTARR